MIRQNITSPWLMAFNEHIYNLHEETRARRSREREHNNNSFAGTIPDHRLGLDIKKVR